MAYLMNVTVLYSTSRQRQAQRLTDVYFNPPLDRVGMLQWKRLDDIVQQGLEHARQVLDQQPAGKPAAMPAAGDD
jgi:NTE family protein